MKKFAIKSILVPSDFSETAANALREAVFMARINKAKITLLHVIQPVYMTETSSVLPDTDAFYKRLRTHAEKAFKGIAAEIKKSSSVSVDFEIKFGVVHHTICETAKKDKSDIIMMGTHGVSGFSEFFVGSNAARVVSHAPCPVITVQKEMHHKGFEKIILPIRLDRNSRQKVDFVLEMAKIYKSTVIIAGFTSEHESTKKQKVEQYVNQVEKYLKKEGVDCKKTLIFADNFTKEMIKLAKKSNAHLIAIMNNHDFSLGQLLSGPYAHQFVNHSKIPVMSIPVNYDDDLVTFTPLSGTSGF